VFTLAIDVRPHRYVSRMPLESAMAEITARRLSRAEIALNARFSSQASFTEHFVARPAWRRQNIVAAGASSQILLFRSWSCDRCWSPVAGPEQPFAFGWSDLVGKADIRKIGKNNSSRGGDRRIFWP
jgi:hypothetical protein